MRMFLTGACAGAVCGLLGAGGGMLLVPLLQSFVRLPEEQVFPASVSVMLPVTAVSLLMTPWAPEVVPMIVPCLIGSAIGGLAAGLWGKKVPTLWLHRVLGGLIVWGGIRCLCC